MLFQAVLALLDRALPRRPLIVLPVTTLRVRADAAGVEELKAKLVDLNVAATSIQAKADAEGRSLADQERLDIQNLFEEFDETEADIERRTRIEMNVEKVNASQGRQAPPAGPRAAAGEPEPTRITGAPAIQPSAKSRERHGFDHFGQFARAVMAAAHLGQAQIGQRLGAQMAVPSTYGTEGIGADGGFAVPPEFRNTIMEKVLDEANLLALTDQLTSSTNTISIPTDETTPWQTTGGVQAYWENEAGLLSQSKPALQSTSIRLNKITALVGVTEELLSDAPALSTYLTRKAPSKINFKISRAIVAGTGVGQPLGILNSPAKVAITKETNQVADTICFENVTKMWSRMYSECWRNSVWLANQDIMQQMLSLGLTVPNPAQTTWYGGTPVYLPPGGLSASPYGSLLGRPVRFTEACETLGDEGDLILWDPTQYLTAMKTGGIRADVSMHLWFDYDMSAFRFILRVAGQPWWSSSIAARSGVAGSTKSCIVTIEARA